MLLTIVLIGVALFVMAFVGLNKLLPTIFGLGAVIGAFFGLYLVYLSFTSSDQNIFIWGCLALLGSAAVLIYLKSAWSD